jgi:hypothetical protein
MSYASSADSHRLTSGQDVRRGVEVPVVPGTAGRARPLPGAQAQPREPVPARRAGLGRRVPPVDHDQVPAVPFTFVDELAAELGPAAVRDRAGQVPTCRGSCPDQAYPEYHLPRNSPVPARVTSGLLDHADLVWREDLGRGCDVRPFGTEPVAPVSLRGPGAGWRRRRPARPSGRIALRPRSEFISAPDRG